MTLTEKLAEIEAGLEGVTPGPWRQNTDIVLRPPALLKHQVKDLNGRVIADCLPVVPNYPNNATQNERESLAAHIARCHPDFIRAWLDRDRALMAFARAVRDAANSENYYRNNRTVIFEALSALRAAGVRLEQEQ